jgi:hypothetical protein
MKTKMKLKELLKGIYEKHCERLPEESDEDFLSRCGNNMFNQVGKAANINHAPIVMKKQIVVPNQTS